jgi:hypothetical protein
MYTRAVPFQRCAQTKVNHMKFFPNPDKASEKRLTETVTSRDAAATRLAVAQGAVAECTKALSLLTAQGADDAALDAGEAKLLKAERRVVTLLPDLAEKEALVATAKAERAETLDAKTRAQTDAKANELADELVEAGQAAVASNEILAEVCARAVAVTFDATGLHVFAQSSCREIAAATGVISLILREHGRRVRNKLEPAKFPTAAPPEATPVPVVPPATRHVFSVRHISWTDETGMRVQAGGFECDLPPAVAARGLKTGAIALIGSEAFRTMKGTRPITYPAPERCENLDGNDGVGEPKAEPQAQHEVIRHAAFEVVDLGPPRMYKIGGTS